MVEEAGAVPGILDLLRAWADRSTKMLREARGLERRFLGHREWFYHNLARDLCCRYQQISIVALDPKDTASGAVHRTLLPTPISSPRHGLSRSCAKQQ